jgi:hypothetical protein
MRIVSATTPVWFLLSHTAAAQLLANSCSPLRFAWTTRRRTVWGISVRLTSCSRSPALADLTTQAKQRSAITRAIFEESSGLRKLRDCTYYLCLARTSTEHTRFVNAPHFIRVWRVVACRPRILRFEPDMQNFLISNSTIKPRCRYCL